MSEGYDAAISPFTEAEILAHAGIAYGGADTLESELGPVDQYVLDFSPTGDRNADNVVDLRDYTRFTVCLAGPATPKAPWPCRPSKFNRADVTGDYRVDLLDFGRIQAAFTGS